MKGFSFESGFTEAEYGKFVEAVTKREDYTFCYGKYTDKMQARIYGTRSDNGVWEPENYYWSVSTTDRRDGFSGRSNPFRIGELKTYAELIDYVYEMLKLPRPAGFQQTFF